MAVCRKACCHLVEVMTKVRRPKTRCEGMNIQIRLMRLGEKSCKVTRLQQKSVGMRKCRFLRRKGTEFGQQRTCRTDKNGVALGSLAANYRYQNTHTTNNNFILNKRDPVKCEERSRLQKML